MAWKRRQVSEVYTKQWLCMDSAKWKQLNGLAWQVNKCPQYQQGYCKWAGELSVKLTITSGFAARGSDISITCWVNVYGFDEKYNISLSITFSVFWCDSTKCQNALLIGIDPGLLRGKWSASLSWINLITICMIESFQLAMDGCR